MNRKSRNNYSHNLGAVMTAEINRSKIEYLIVNMGDTQYKAKVFKREEGILKFTNMEDSTDHELKLQDIDAVYIKWHVEPSEKMLKCIQAMIEVVAEDIGYTLVGGELELVVAGMNEFTLERAVWAVEKWKDDTLENIM